MRERLLTTAVLLALLTVFSIDLWAQDRAADSQHLRTAADQPPQEAYSVGVAGHSLRIFSPAMGARLQENFVNVHYGLSNPVSAGPPNFRIELDDRDPVTTRLTSHVFTGLMPGRHTVRVQLVDANGTVIANTYSETQFIVLEAIGTPGAMSSDYNVGHAESSIPSPVASVLKEQAKIAPPLTAGPRGSPVLKLTFFGFVGGAGQPTKVFLTKGNDVFIAGVGEIAHFYRVIKINPSSVEVEDILSNAHETISLTTD